MLRLYIKPLYYVVLFSPLLVNAADFSITISSTSGNPVKNTVVTLTAKKKNKPLTTTTHVIDQINKTYVPHVKIISVGSKISFPNKDNIRHHVYSFSEAKKFELPLYEGTPTNPVIFNKPGIVTLGCNIHDWMSAYIYVSDTPHYNLTTETGTASIKNLPAGNYTLNIWHPRLKDKTAKPKKISLSKNDSISEQATIILKPSFKIRRAPKAKRRRY